MKTKFYFLAALATVALASCSDNEFVGETSPTAFEGGDGSINFSYRLPAATRADQDHTTSAATLGNQFIVWGEKNESGGSAASAGNLVFKNYLVEYGANTAYTTTSNTQDWEYVGVTPFFGGTSFVAPNNGAGAQTIKYWDYSATNYAFTAVSAKQTDISSGNVKFTKIESGADVYKKGYTLTLEGAADKSKIFIADRVPVLPTPGTDRNADNTYGGNVTLKFRNVLSHVRAGMYETVPGYKVTIKQFYVQDAAAPTFDGMTTAKTANFAANVPNVPTTTNTTLTVTYSSETATLNQPTIAVTGTKNNFIELGTNLKADVDLNTTVYEPTYDKTAGAYTAVFSQEANDKSMKLKLDYTLTSTDGSGETIEVVGATAEVPAKYLQWKPNYKYTYIFKISENTNGSTGQGVVGLYPITFDAVVAVAEDGLAEYITTVSEPSITTFGVKDGKYTAHGNTFDYAATSDIYAVVMDGGAVQTPTLGTNVNIYKNISSSNATNFPVTESSLAEAIAETGGSAGEKITYSLDNTIATVRSGADAANGIPSEDGNVITGVPAVKLANLAAGTYAVEYIKTPDAFTTDGGKTYATSEAFAAAGTLYKEAACTNVADASYYASNSGATYYKKIVNLPGTKVYKIIVVQ